ncbi:MAG: hypothetical protein NG747_03530 [Candidatus Brocadia sp.]|nr:hypothetical protein [Candidatus Brocadia sp.]
MGKIREQTRPLTVMVRETIEEDNPAEAILRPFYSVSSVIILRFTGNVKSLRGRRISEI